MELRRLQATDLFMITKIIKGIGIDKITKALDVKALLSASAAEKSGEKVDVRAVGVDVVMSVVSIIIENLADVEQDVYKFTGSVASMKPSDVAKMDIGDFMDLIVAIVKKEEFTDFFKRASKLIG